MRQSFSYLNDKLLSYYLFMRSNTSIKRKSSKKRSDCEGYFVEMCLGLIRKVCRGRKVTRALTTHFHNMLFTANNVINQMFHLLFSTDYKPESQGIRLIIYFYLSLIC